MLEWREQRIGRTGESVSKNGRGQPTGESKVSSKSKHNWGGKKKKKQPNPQSNINRQPEDNTGTLNVGASQRQDWGNQVWQWAVTDSGWDIIRSGVQARVLRRSGPEVKAGSSLNRRQGRCVRFNTWAIVRRRSTEKEETNPSRETGAGNYER